MSKIKIKYKCNVCGKEESKWFGQCTGCKEWNTAEEINEESLMSLPNNLNNIKVKSNKKAKLLKEVSENKDKRLITNISEFDSVMGGGIVSDSISILTAPPGAGKSTLCLQVCDKLIELGKNVLYASGEESSSQIKSRAIRLRLKNVDEKLWIIDDSNMDLVVEEIKNKDIDFFVLDSINAYFLNEQLPSRPGTPSQVLSCAETIRNVCKNSEKPISCLIIGQMTKDESLAGSRALEHLVDTYLRLEGEREEQLRMLIAVKNRFGCTDETGFFYMTEEGLECINNPSEYFMTERTESVIGSTLTVSKEGNRPVIAEIESIVSNSYTPYPSRIGDSLKKEQLNILVSILEQRANINLYNKNVVIKTGGNIRFRDASCNLAIIMSIVSSVYKQPIDCKSVYIADVGLTGELKKVQNIEQRIKELDKRGYKKVYIADFDFKGKLNLENLEVIKCKTLKEVIDKSVKTQKIDVE